MSENSDKDLGKLRWGWSRSEAFVRDKSVSWNYDKYAYIRVRSTGESKTVILLESSMELGDGINLGQHQLIYIQKRVVSINLNQL